MTWITTTLSLHVATTCRRTHHANEVSPHARMRPHRRGPLSPTPYYPLLPGSRPRPRSRRPRPRPSRRPRPRPSRRPRPRPSRRPRPRRPRRRGGEGGGGGTMLPKPVRRTHETTASHIPDPASSQKKGEKGVQARGSSGRGIRVDTKRALERTRSELLRSSSTPFAGATPDPPPNPHSAEEEVGGVSVYPRSLGSRRPLIHLSESGRCRRARRSVHGSSLCVIESQGDASAPQFPPR